ncbi:MAG: hypothetical protein Q9P14_06940 [candidate division KSB1 bacterium]|nr:hypothetical protein [candidate division KSB1 bacterium]
MGFQINDINQDGYDELIITMPFNHAGNIESAGNVFIIWGRADWPKEIDLSGNYASQRVEFLEGNYRGMMFSAVLNAADFDQNGKLDLVFDAETRRLYPLGKGLLVFDAYYDNQIQFTLTGNQKITKILNHSEYLGGEFFYETQVLDWNDDGYPDLFFSNPGGGQKRCRWIC